MNQDPINERGSRSESDKARTYAKALWLLKDDLALRTKDLALLMDLNVRTLRDARKKGHFPCLSNDRLLRLAHLLGINKSLEIIFPRNEEIRKNWLHVKRDLFNGKSALEMIEADPLNSLPRLYAVRRVLELYRVGTIHNMT
ncbi:hypothetical protein [Pseudobacteriovorax antillogorgiicola]|uniref:Uncharacterized protein n=1 Tax=Pseudobacteriovorax antillogorgiicola TaxID=1513793 RepID=A0A1Y6CPL1_9BACT|nr:hypothetical protein [Pseudobacteriovorax antillogorgiicola]TCS46739.1 hypothetical protein EDD56_123115 [Pseudobacteriovorax antillogorgiicola]SMF67492.1 hypothetical protein SAMN06296036_123115 [Pseudobacteriovorax antillogorgiicola]